MTEFSDKKKNETKVYPREEIHDHANRSFDGIDEENNPMPRWWVWLFYACIAFSAFYMAWYHIPGFPGKSLQAEYIAATSKENPAGAEAAKDDVLTVQSASSDAKRVEAGKELYIANCASCHLADGGGLVGPNLVDDAWIHGNTMADVIAGIEKGFPEKGMPGWGTILGKEKILKIASYVASLQGTTPKTPKAAQGQSGKLK
jgi:cytochrome c oxidase cbb3-type subunit III